MSLTQENLTAVSEALKLAAENAVELATPPVIKIVTENFEVIHQMRTIGVSYEQITKIINDVLNGSEIIKVNSLKNAYTKLSTDRKLVKKQPAVKKTNDQ